MEATSVGHRPGGKWTFDGDVTGVFEDMLQRSIPQYAVMRAAVADLSRRFRRPATDIVDLGCSRGEALDPLIQEYGATNRYVAVDVSEPMLQVCRERWKGLIETGIVRVLPTDLRKMFPPCRASVVLSVLTLQFVPIEYRQRVLGDAHAALLDGGALIVVEKVLGRGPLMDALMVDVYHRLKLANGYSQDDVERKRLALEGALVPVTAKMNEELLRDAGFSHVELFWRWFNFAGWLAVKG